MFGYVTVFKDELKIKDYNIYRAYYCGLCKRLGEKFGTVFRLGLSYDLTFLAIVTDAVCDEKTAFSMQGRKASRQKKIGCGKQFCAELCCGYEHCSFLRQDFGRYGGRALFKGAFFVSSVQEGCKKNFKCRK